MLKNTVEIINKLGLHARASSKLTTTAGQFSCEVLISRKGKTVNAEDIVGLMSLGATQGTTIEISVEGADEENAMHALLALINDYFGEGE